MFQFALPDPGEGLLEADIVPKEGLPFATIDLQGFERHITLDKLRRAGKALVGVGKAAPVPLLLSGDKAAHLLGVTPRTLRRLSAPSGPIPVVRLGRLIRYARADLEQAVRTLRVGQETQP